MYANFQGSSSKTVELQPPTPPETVIEFATAQFTKLFGAFHSIS